MTVYVVQDHTRYNRDTRTYEAVYDLSDAERFGPIVKLYGPTDGPMTPVDQVAALLASFDADDDFLLLIGSPVLCAIAFTIAALAGGGQVPVLVWQRRESCYVVVDTDLSDLVGGEM